MGFGFNKEYGKSGIDVLNICEVVIGFVCILLLSVYAQRFDFMVNNDFVFFVSTISCFFIGSGIIMILCVATSDGDGFHALFFEPMFYTFGALCYTGSALLVLIDFTRHLDDEAFGLITSGIHADKNPHIWTNPEFRFELWHQCRAAKSVTIIGGLRWCPAVNMNVSRAVNTVSQLPMLGSGCWGCCCCGSWPCANLNFLRTRDGIIKLLEIILGGICQNLLINYAFTYSSTLGSSYYGFLTTVSSATMVSLILLIIYVISIKSLQLIRQSLFEIVFNGTICFFYIASSTYLAFANYTFLYPIYKVWTIFQTYPEMNVIYMVGYAAGVLHGYDAWSAFKRSK